MADIFTLRKPECLKQAYDARMTVHGIMEKDLASVFVGSSEGEIMINRDRRGHRYLAVRGEILRPAKDQLLRKHLPRMFSLIKNES